MTDPEPANTTVDSICDSNEAADKHVASGAADSETVVELAKRRVFSLVIHVGFSGLSLGEIDLSEQNGNPSTVRWLRQ